LTVLVDGEAVPWGTSRTSDVVVIGAGPAGLTIARRLAADGRHVALVEIGGERQRRRDRAALAGTSVGEPFPLVSTRGRAYGGASIHWRRTTGLRTRPLDAVDFESSDARPGTSWPFGREELQRYYRQADELVGTPGDYEASTWYGSGPPSELAVGDGDGLAYFCFGDHDVFVRSRAAVLASSRIDLLMSTEVVAIDVRDSGAVDSMVVRTEHGNELRIAATSYVLAGGAIENARLLLESPGLTGAGVGNEHDLVGRYFMDHISIDSGVVSTSGGNGLDVSAFLQRTHRSGVRCQPMLWVGDDVIREQQLLNVAFWPFRIDAAYLSPAVDGARGLLHGRHLSPPFPDIGRDLAAAVGGAGQLLTFALRWTGVRRGEDRIVLRALAEQAPRADSRILLGRERDRTGRRRVVMDWRVSDVDVAMIRRHQEVLAAGLEQRGVGTVVDRLADGREPLVQTNHHHLGGTRMHDDPARGVVDRQCRVHSAPNLYVAGSSVFPTGGYVNPTLTIIALALRIADAITRDLSPPTMAAIHG
jgi:choline dehydrogenase-like flavoprotein